MTLPPLIVSRPPSFARCCLAALAVAMVLGSVLHAMGVLVLVTWR